MRTIIETKHIFVFTWFAINELIFKYKTVTILINVSSGSNHSSKFTVLVVLVFRKREGKEIKQQAKQTFNLIVSIVAFVSEYFQHFGANVICSYTFFVRSNRGK